MATVRGHAQWDALLRTHQRNKLQRAGGKDGRRRKWPERKELKEKHRKRTDGAATWSQSEWESESGEIKPDKWVETEKRQRMTEYELEIKSELIKHKSNIPLFLFAPPISPKSAGHRLRSAKISNSESHKEERAFCVKHPNNKNIVSVRHISFCSAKINVHVFRDSCQKGNGY